MAAPANTNTIGEHDVLLGRGGATNNNPGNIKFREIVSSQQMVYLAAKKKEKKAIAELCVKTVKANGGRFLKRDNDSGCWVEVPPAAACKKASQALREGLDVRHKRIREGKSGLILTEPDRRKRQKVVTGTVATTATTKAVASPSVVSVAGDEGAVPELKEEQMPSAATFKPTKISPKDCEQTMYI